MADERTPDTPNTPNAPYSFDNPKRRLVYERLTRLVGPGAADFYKDACRLMSDSVNPPLSATTHLVAHMLREIESPLRKVLVPLVKEKPEESAPAATEETSEEIVEPSHIEQIRLVLAMLEIPEDSDLGRGWLSIPGKETGLQKYAHRPGLESVRPLDNKFRDFWEKMDTILQGVLERFESKYVLVFTSIEQLAKKDDPRKVDGTHFANSVPNNFVSHSRFFNNLKSPKWLPILRARGVFKETPPIEYGYQDGSKTIRYPLWPAASYLLEMAKVKPEEVREVLGEVEDTDNANTKSSLLDIATALPKQERLVLLGKIKTWVRADHSMYIARSANALITKFIEDREVAAAISVAKVLLEMKADKREPVSFGEGKTYTPSPRPRSRMDDWQYGHFMREEFKQILTLDADAALALAMDLLEEYVVLGHPDNLSGQHAFKDHTYIPRPAIEDHEQNRFHDDLDDHLIEAVRDAASSIVAKDRTQLGFITELLVKRKWSVFYRVAMHLVSESENPDPVVVSTLLMRSNSFNASEEKHEYSRLIGRHFNLLSSEEQETIYDWIEKASYIDELYGSKDGAAQDDEHEQRKEYWRLEKLSIIGEHLSSEWKAKREVLIAKYKEPEHPDFASYSRQGSGPTSVISAADLLQMTPEKILEFLKTWEPEESKRWFGPTRDGLAREIANAIRSNPELFEKLAKDFEGLDPTYIRTYIQTFHELSQNGRVSDWPSLVTLSQWVMDQPRAIPDRKGEVMDQDPDWGWTRRAITSLVATGLSQKVIPFDLRESVWKVIESLTKDPHPTIEDESKKDNPIEDSYAHAINTVRGHAIQMAIEYGLWVRKNFEAGNISTNGFSDAPELQVVLEEGLNDPTIAVRAIYGRFIPWLHLIDKSWLIKVLPDIFPGKGLQNPLYRAAWTAYVLYVPAYNEIFELLREQHAAAVADLSVTPYSEKDSCDPQRKLSEHLVVMYWRGVIKLDDPLLTSFWALADDALKEHLMDFVGMSIRNETDPLSCEQEGLFRQLWESRVAEAETATDPSRYEKEMAGFGWWFSSGKFEEDWVSDQYLRVLDFGSQMRTHHFVAEALVRVSSSKPLKVLQILSKMIDLNQPSWMIMGDRHEVTSVLRTGLQSSDALVQKLGREIVSRLIARGHTEYADLLIEFPEQF